MNISQILQDAAKALRCGNSRRIGEGAQ